MQITSTDNITLEFSEDCELFRFIKDGKHFEINSNQMTSTDKGMYLISETFKSMKVEPKVIQEAYGQEFVLTFGEAKLSVGEYGDYLRVLNSNDEEILYNVIDEIIEEPDFVFGATMGALVSNH